MTFFTTKYRNALHSQYFVVLGAQFWTGLSNRCTFGLDNQLVGTFAPPTELEINRFQHLPFGELVWHLSTQVNSGLLAVYITAFDLRRDKFRWLIPCLVYAMFYPVIYSNLLNLANLSPNSDSFCMHTCSPFSRKPLLRQPRMVKTGLLINW